MTTNPRSLIRAFVIRLFESIISELATSKLSVFQITSVAEQVDLGMPFLETQKTGFSNAVIDFVSLLFREMHCFSFDHIVRLLILCSTALF